jgi:hypothetical protein
VLGSRHGKRARWLRVAFRVCVAPRRSSRSRRRSSRWPSPRGQAQGLAREQPARGQGRVDEVVLPPPSVLAPRALALVDDDLGSREEASESGAVTARPLDREGRHAELLHPGKQPAIAVLTDETELDYEVLLGW